jgi:hypothetical protein
VEEEDEMPGLQQAAWTHDQLQRALLQQEEEYRAQQEYREFNRDPAEEVEEERQLREAFGEWRNGILHEHRVWNDRDMMSDVFGPTEDDPRGTLQCVSSSGYLDTDRWIMSGRREPDEGLPFQLNARRLEPRGHVVAGRAMSIGSELIMIRIEGIWVYGVVHKEGHRIYREPGMVRYRMAWIREAWRIMPALTMEEEDQAVARIRARASQPRRGTNVGAGATEAGYPRLCGPKVAANVSGRCKMDGGAEAGYWKAIAGVLQPGRSVAKRGWGSRSGPRSDDTFWRTREREQKGAWRRSRWRAALDHAADAKEFGSRGP